MGRVLDVQCALAGADNRVALLGYSDAENSPLDQLYFGLTALFWMGHRLSSSYLAYCTEAYRPLLRSQPIRFVVLPLAVTVGCFAVFLPADAALPWNRAERVVVMAIIDYVFVTYHFATQHFGALSLYRARVGRSACTATRKMDRIFALCVGGFWFFWQTSWRQQLHFRTTGSIGGIFSLAVCGSGRNPDRCHHLAGRRDSGDSSSWSFAFAAVVSSARALCSGDRGDGGPCV